MELKLSEAWAEKQAHRIGDEHEDGANRVEEPKDPDIRDLSDESSKRDGEAAEEHAPSPLRASEGNSVKGFSALKGDDELACDCDALDSDEPWVRENSLVPVRC